MITAQNISKFYGDRSLFKNVNINIKDGDKIALVGSNGSGKTTLMDILSGRTSPSNGKVSVAKDTQIGYLTQELAIYSGKTLIQEVLTVSSDLVNLNYNIDKNPICDTRNPFQPNQMVIIGALYYILIYHK